VPAPRGGRPGHVGDPLVGPAEDGHLDELGADDPVGDARPVTAERMRHVAVGQ